MIRVIFLASVLLYSLSGMSADLDETITVLETTLKKNDELITEIEKLQYKQKISDRDGPIALIRSVVSTFHDRPKIDKLYRQIDGNNKELITCAENLAGTPTKQQRKRCALLLEKIDLQAKKIKEIAQVSNDFVYSRSFK